MAKLSREQIAVETVNAIREGATPKYQEMIPKATLNNIRNVGDSILALETTFNEFTGTMVNKIGKLVINRMDSKNRFAQFNRGMMHLGYTVEEVYIDLIQSLDYDPLGKTTLTRRKPNVKTMYHSQNSALTFPVSISRQQLRSAFQSPTGINDMVQALITSLWQSAEYTEYLATKTLLGGYTGYKTRTIPTVTSEITAKTVMKEIRKAVNDISFMSSEYNAEGVVTSTKPEDQILIIHKDLVAELDVEVLSKAFNLGKVDFETKLVVVDDFGDLATTGALLVDREFLMIFDTLLETTQQYNAEGMFMNHFLQKQQILSLSRFRNAIAFNYAP